MKSLKDCQVVAAVFAQHRRPLDADEVQRLSGYSYFTACDICVCLIELGIVDIASRHSDGRINEAIFAPELSGENLDQVVEFFYLAYQKEQELSSRIKELEMALSVISKTVTKTLVGKGAP